MVSILAERSEQMAIADLMSSSGVGFGTSGARGLADAMTDRVCYAYTVGFLQYLEKQSAIRPGDDVAVAGDLRPSTPRIMTACLKAIGDLGYNGINSGYVPSPAVANLGIRNQFATLMVTGSHIPDDRNGIKFNRPEGEILKADEMGIREQVVRIPDGLFDDNGGFVQRPASPAEDSAAYRQYVSRYLDYFSADALAGNRVLVYQHSSVAAPVVREILQGLGAEVIMHAASDTFVPVDTEAVRPEDVALARQWGGDSALSFDIIVSTDGDGDRPLIGDEQGEWFRGDVIGVLAAHFLQADGVVTPVSSNTALEKSGWFENTRRTRIGSPFVIEGMQGLADDGAENVVGYEANGGFLTFSDIQSDNRVLPALPTRDAILVALALLLLAKRQGLKVSELAELMPPRFTASDRLKEFPTEISQQRIAQLRDGGETAISALFPEFGDVAEVDNTDGLRITFANQEVVHLRPSGNAPELRCYNEADTAERAMALNRQCLDIMSAWRT